MRNVLPSALLGLIAFGWAAGCAPPVVTMRHGHLVDLPIPDDVQALEVRDFAVTRGPKDAYGALLADALAERLNATGRYNALRTARSTVVQAIAGGTVTIEVRDSAGSRTIRRKDSETGRVQTVEVPTLVRRADVRAVLNVTQPAAGMLIASAGSAAGYDSLEDPRVRGELGLERPDDPDRVPPADTIIRELLAAHADAMAMMMKPVEVAAEVRLRPASDAESQKGFREITRGDPAAAVAHFQAAHAAAPQDVNRLFNLAAAEEAAGRLEAALARYLAVREVSGLPDLGVDGAIGRLERVLYARRRAAAAEPR